MHAPEILEDYFRPPLSPKVVKSIGYFDVGEHLERVSITKLAALDKSNRAYLPRETFRELVLRLHDKYGSQKSAAKAIGIHPSRLSLYYHGKQLSVLVGTLLVILRKLDEKETVIEKVEPFDEFMRCAAARNYAKLKPPLVSFGKVVTGEDGELAINVLKWLEELRYVERLKRMGGVVRIKGIQVGNDLLKLEYEVFDKRNSSFVKRILTLPRVLPLNHEAMYFLGLWSGDNAGGGRVGIVNTETNLLEVTGALLQKCFKQPAGSLIGYVMSDNASGVTSEQLSPLRKAGVDRIKHVFNPKCYRKLVFIICVHNGPLKKLFDFLKRNLEEIFVRVNANERGSFYAGLFDAEGNVNNSTKGICFRWSTLNPDFAKFLITRLEKDGFVPKYDGANVKIGCRKETRRVEFQRFGELIMPHIRHPRKRRAAQGLLKLWR